MTNETLLKMRSDKFASMNVTAPSPGVTAGLLTNLSSGLVGCFVETKDTGVAAAFIYKAEKIVVAKKAGTGLTIAQGGKVYYISATNDVAGASATGRRICGIALAAAAADDTTVEIELDGSLGITAQTS